MTLAERITFLKTTDLLKDASEDLLTYIADGMTEVIETAGIPLFHAGDAGDAVYLVVDGILSIQKDGVQLITRSKGEYVGEFALIDDAPRSTDALAETDVLLLRWARTDFQTALALRPKVAEGVFKILLAKLREDVETQVSAGLERERWQQDLKRAHEIQMGMLPSEDLITNAFEISGFCQPASDVGGDYYDYQILNKDQVGVIIGDVTGHGFYSGLFVAMAKTCLHLQAGTEDRPDRIMAAMNRTVSLSMQNDMLMTCCYVRIDPQFQKLIYCNAGHNYPYHYNRQTDVLEPLESTDPLLGIPGFESLPFHQEEKSWTQGDLLILYSDGVTEAQNSQTDMFEEDRLEKVILENKNASAVVVKEAILKAHAHHCQGTIQEDDVTLVVIRAL